MPRAKPHNIILLTSTIRQILRESSISLSFPSPRIAKIHHIPPIIFVRLSLVLIRLIRTLVLEIFSGLISHMIVSIPIVSTVHGRRVGLRHPRARNGSILVRRRTVRVAWYGTNWSLLLFELQSGVCRFSPEPSILELRTESLFIGYKRGQTAQPDNIIRRKKHIPRYCSSSLFLLPPPCLGPVLLLCKGQRDETTGYFASNSPISRAMSMYPP
jgi:hypothetical protein